MTSGVVTASERRYAAHLSSPGHRVELPVHADGAGTLCVSRPSSARHDDEYAVLDVWAYAKEHTTYPLRVHWAQSGSVMRVVGIERPTSHEPFSF